MEQKQRKIRKSSIRKGVDPLEGIPTLPEKRFCYSCRESYREEVILEHTLKGHRISAL